MTTDTLATTDEIAPTIAVSPTDSSSDDCDEQAVVNGTHCDHCEAYADWDGGSWCPACGYHPRLKRCVDLPKSVQVEAGPENVWQAIPQWAWIFAGGVLAVIGMSVTVRMQLIDSPRERAAWTFTQIALGEFATLVVHVLALIHASTVSDRYSPFDLIIKPLSLWKPTFAQLPRNAWRVWVFGWSQTAIFCAIALIGGVNYNALFDDWGVEKKTSVNLVQSVADQARDNGEDADSLEDALNNTAGAAEELTDDENAEEKQRPTAECLIIGYRSRPEGEISSLLLATTVNGRMRYVGMLAIEGLPDDVVANLQARLPALSQKHPFVKCRFPAAWLQPRLMCEVEYEEWGYDHQMKRPKFRRMLSDLEAR